METENCLALKISTCRAKLETSARSRRVKISRAFARKITSGDLAIDDASMHPARSTFQNSNPIGQ